MGAAFPLLIAGTAVGAAGGVGGIVNNIVVGKKNSSKQLTADQAMENLGKLEEAFRKAAEELVKRRKEMTEDQRRATDEMLALSENTIVRRALEGMGDSTFKGESNSSDDFRAVSSFSNSVAAASFAPISKQVAEEAAEVGAKSLGKVAGGVVVGVSALFLIADGVTMTKTAMELWRNEPSKAAEMLRELAEKLSEGEEK